MQVRILPSQLLCLILERKKMITIEEIKEKIIELGFELEEQMIPKFDQYTGEKLLLPERYLFKIKDYFFKVDFTPQICNDNSIAVYSLGCFLHLRDSNLRIEPFWNLFLQLLEEHTK